MDTASNYFNQFGQMAIDYAPKVIGALLTYIIGTFIIDWLTKMLSSTFQKRNVDHTIRPFFVSIVSVGLKIMLLLTVAGMFGVQTTSFIAIFTALVFAIGTALSGTLGHFASGVMLLIFKPYKVGDLVTVAGQTGSVEEIAVFNTVLRTLDNKKIIIPNGNVTSNIITNISGQGQIRVDMLYNVANSNDVDKVRAVVQQVSDSCPKILKTPACDILVQNSPMGMTEFAVRPWCNSADYWDVYYFMQENIKKAFDKNGIVAPKPGMDVVVSQH